MHTHTLAYLPKHVSVAPQTLTLRIRHRHRWPGAAGLTTISHKLPRQRPHQPHAFAHNYTHRFKRSSLTPSPAATTGSAYQWLQQSDRPSPGPGPGAGPSRPTKSSRATEEEANDPSNKMTGQHTHMHTHSVRYHLWVAASLTWAPTAQWHHHSNFNSSYST